MRCKKKEVLKEEALYRFMISYLEIIQIGRFLKQT